MIKFRVSDGYSAAEEFSAASADQFNRRLRAALLALSVVKYRGVSAQLHIHAGGEWGSAQYPDNAPLHVRLGDLIPPDLWNRCVAAHAKLVFFHEQINGLAGFVAARGPVTLTIVEPDECARPPTAPA